MQLYEIENYLLNSKKTNSNLTTVSTSAVRFHHAVFVKAAVWQVLTYLFIQFGTKGFCLRDKFEC